MVRPGGLELPTFWFVGKRSEIHKSCAWCRIRTKNTFLRAPQLNLSCT